MKPFLYLDGIKELAPKLKGIENVHVGIRPLGFHAGNKLAILVYPFLLCEEFEKTNRVPKFNFFISLNDFEPNALKYLEKDRDGNVYYKKISEYRNDEEPTFESNIFCEETNIKNMKDAGNCCPSAVDHYQKVIKNEVEELFSRRFKQVKFNFIRNSDLLRNPVFQKYIKTIISSPEAFAAVIKSNTKQKILTNNVKYAGVVCPKCKKANGQTTLGLNEIVSFDCFSCRKKFIGRVVEFDYWIYHKPLLIPRILIFNIDLTIRGADHYQCGDVDVNAALLKKFEPDFKPPLTLITPLVVDDCGHKLSKSYGNTVDIPTDSILEFARKSSDSVFVVSKITLLEKMIAT